MRERGWEGEPLIVRIGVSRASESSSVPPRTLKRLRRYIVVKKATSAKVFKEKVEKSELKLISSHRARRLLPAIPSPSSSSLEKQLRKINQKLNKIFNSFLTANNLEFQTIDQHFKM